MRDFEGGGNGGVMVLFSTSCARDFLVKYKLAVSNETWKTFGLKKDLLGSKIPSLVLSCQIGVDWAAPYKGGKRPFRISHFPIFH